MENQAEGILASIISFVEGLFEAMGLSEIYHDAVNFITSFADFF